MHGLRALLLIATLGAALHAEAVVEIDENSAAGLTSLGNRALAAEQYPRAIQFFQRALDKEPSYLYARFNLALAHQQMGSLNDAIQHYEEVLRVQPNSADALCNLGYIAYEQGDYRTAAKRFEDAAQIAAASPAKHSARDAADLYYNLGTATEQSADWPQARGAYEQALRFHPDHFRSAFNLGTLFLGPLSDDREAEVMLRKAHQLKPDATKPLLNLARLAERVPRIGDAEAFLDRAVRTAQPGSDDHQLALWHRIRYYDQLVPPRKLDMRADLEALLSVNPSYPDANGMLGLYYDSLADYQRATELLQEEVRDLQQGGASESGRSPTEIELECLYTLATIYTEHLVNPAKALQHATAYYRHQPQSPSARELSSRAMRLNDDR